MSHDPLQSNLQQIEQFCKQHDIALAYGESHNITDVDLVWDNDSSSTGLAQTLALVKQASIRLLHVHRTYNNLEIEQAEIDEFLSYQEDEEDRTAQLRDINLVRQKKGHLVCFELGFYYQGGLYAFQQAADWQPLYEEIREYFSGESAKDDDGDDDYDDDGEQDDDTNSPEPIIEAKDSNPDDDGRLQTGEPPWRKPASEGLSDEEIERQARSILTNAKFLSAANHVERRQIANRLIDPNSVKGFFDYRAIQEKAVQLYKEEIEPGVHAAIIQKIKELQSVRPKLSKTAIAAKLKMTLNKLNKYWYLAEES